MQPDLFTRTPVFDSGVELTTADHERLGAQILRVRDVLWDGQWHSVPGISNEIRRRFDIRDPDTSISAQIRNLRKQKHGGHVIQRMRYGNGWYFRLVTPEGEG